jgi:hypothetical protein
VGRALAHLLHEATGDKIGYVVLFGLAVIAAVVIVDVPLASLIDKVREAWAEWREAAAERREVAHAMRAKQVVAKPKVNEVVKESGSEPWRASSIERLTLMGSLGSPRRLRRSLRCGY